ncbi:testis-expressed protein 51 isoform X2 [Pelodiscus sinensis]|uniref:testis-expressed protein 51 isoform X2 n=1 Tax=Pelodiscus sinensis TaxID=13735 RepID=UPI003F6CF1B9
MEREHLEQEAGKLFYHLDQIITRNRQETTLPSPPPDPERLVKEAAFEKQNFTRHLRAASAAVLQQDRPEPFDLANCGSCQHLQARCRDPTVCAGSAVSQAVGLSLGLLALGAAVGAYVYYRRRAKRAAGTETEEEPAAGRTEPPAEQGDGAPVEPGDGAPKEQGEGAPMEQGDVPTVQVDGAQPQDSEGARAGTQ